MLRARIACCLAALAGVCDGAQRSASQFVPSFSAQLQRLGDVRARVHVRVHAHAARAPSRRARARSAIAGGARAALARAPREAVRPPARARNPGFSASTAQAPLSTLACIGPRKSGKGVLVGKLLGAPVEDEEGELECVLSEDEKLAVLNSAGFGERPGDAPAFDEAADTAVAVALSQVVVLTAFFREFLAEPADAVGRLSELRPAMELLLRMSRQPGASPPRKRSLILVLREYEPDASASAQALRERFVALLEEMWAALPAARSGGGAPALADLLDVQVAPLPSPKADSAAFTAAASELRAKLRAALSSSPAPPAAQLLFSLAAASKLASSSVGPGFVSADELAAALACARAASAAFDEFASATATLHARAASRDDPLREPPAALADECSKALGAALRAYDDATVAHAGSDVRAKRRATLRSAILADLRPVHTHALQLARIGAVIDLSKRAANLTAGEGNLHADLQAAVDDVTASFREKAAMLTMREAAGAWSCGLEEKMLQQVPAPRTLFASRARAQPVSCARSSPRAAPVTAAAASARAALTCRAAPRRAAAFWGGLCAGAAANERRDGAARAAAGALRAAGGPRADRRVAPLAAPQPVWQGPAQRPAVGNGPPLLLAEGQEPPPPRADALRPALDEPEERALCRRHRAHRRRPRAQEPGARAARVPCAPPPPHRSGAPPMPPRARPAVPSRSAARRWRLCRVRARSRAEGQVITPNALARTAVHAPWAVGLVAVRAGRVGSGVQKSNPWPFWPS